MCFLCNPDPSLHVLETKNLFAMVGHGPLTSRYFLVASKEHVASYADVFDQETAIAAELALIRTRLTIPGLSLLVTEHGRVPVCREDEDDHEAHCFHAHALIFQPMHTDENTIASYFGRRVTFESFSEALTFAHSQNQYYLFSPSVEQIEVFTIPLNIPRQFFRKIIAQQTDDSHLADWRMNPRVELAREIAGRERRRLLDGV